MWIRIFLVANQEAPLDIERAAPRSYSSFSSSFLFLTPYKYIFLFLFLFGCTSLLFSFFFFLFSLQFINVYSPRPKVPTFSSCFNSQEKPLPIIHCRKLYAQYLTIETKINQTSLPIIPSFSLALSALKLYAVQLSIVGTCLEAC